MVQSWLLAISAEVECKCGKDAQQRLASSLWHRLELKAHCLTSKGHGLEYGSCLLEEKKSFFVFMN